jgi:hypothetical protein
MAQGRYIVVVEAEYESEWYLTPWSFSEFGSALNHAIGIARSWQGQPDAPPIRIRADNGVADVWCIGRLLAIAPYVED